MNKHQAKAFLEKYPSSYWSRPADPFVLCHELNHLAVYYFSSFRDFLAHLDLYGTQINNEFACYESIQEFLNGLSEEESDLQEIKSCALDYLLFPENIESESLRVYKNRKDIKILSSHDHVKFSIISLSETEEIKKLHEQMLKFYSMFS